MHRRLNPHPGISAGNEDYADLWYSERAIVDLRPVSPLLLSSHSYPALFVEMPTQGQQAGT
uniref:Uncharacterized protein n=1 Tax=Leersia perrieri TaxID=77586 RepID=A0A0D9XF01_9ORYZ